MKSFFISLCMACPLAALLPVVAAAAGPKPNIVLIFMDDMGYGDIGPFGSSKNRTPNLDRMASEGMKLTSFYAAPVCSVSRSQVITGCYGQRVSIPGVFGPASRFGINAAEHTVAELLKDQGYSTMCIGKWHLGDQPEFLPTRHGFDAYFGIPYSNDMQRKSTESGKRVVPLVRDEKVIELLDDEGQNGIVGRYTEEALKFIGGHQSGPFFLYLPHTAMHVPIHPGDKFRGKSGNGEYGDWVEEVDWSVGQVLDALRNAKLDDNTLVIFSSDNGPWLTQGKNGGEAGPLRGGKSSTFEGGMREPTLARWPGKIAAGSACDAIAGNIDFLPTFVALAGGSVPADRKIDGRDISPLLLGKSQESPREAQYYYRGYKLEAVRVGPWKLSLGTRPDGTGKNPPVEGVCLYNLEREVGEQTNVAAENPEIVGRLQQVAARMAAELGDGKPGPGVRRAGEVAKPRTLYLSEAPLGNKSSDNVVLLQAPAMGHALRGAAAPQVANQPLEIRCEVEPKSASGVIVAQGGASAGYAIYLREGRVNFAVRTGVQSVTNIAAAEPTAGSLVIEAHLAISGEMTLEINGKPAVTGKAPGMLPHQPQEPLCVGFDSGKAVGDYDGASRLEGTIKQLKITAGKGALAGGASKP